MSIYRFIVIGFYLVVAFPALVLAQESDMPQQKSDSSNYSCNLAVRVRCAEKVVRQGRRCLFTVSARDESQNKPVAAQYFLQRTTDDDSSIKVFRQGRTGARGRSKKRVKVRRSAEYSALFPGILCLTNSVSVEVRMRS